MPRRVRKRGRDGVKRGVSSDQVCVLTAINEKGDVFVDMPCLGQLDEASAMESLSAAALDGAIVSTDRLKAYRGVLAQLGAALHRRVDPKDRPSGVINLVNALHSRFKSFMQGFKGVSTRRLFNYLMWFKWAELAKRTDGRSGKLDLLSAQVASGRYVTKWRDYKKTPYPFGMLEAA